MYRAQLRVVEHEKVALRMALQSDIDALKEQVAAQQAQRAQAHEAEQAVAARLTATTQQAEALTLQVQQYKQARC